MDTAVPSRSEHTLVEARIRAPGMRGLVRQRVLETLHQAVEEHPLTLVVAPAGSGKTTAMVQLAAASRRSHAWYRASSTHARPRDLLAHVAQALRPVVGGEPGDWVDVEAAAASLGRVTAGPPTLLMIDDLHELAGADAEQTLEQFVRVMPGWLRVVAATRHTPGFNHPALRVSEDLVEVTADVLRWRPWEVERLFRDYYRMRLRPEEAARLTQHTEGWVAGLQLFHLASRHLPMARRIELIDGLHTRPGLVRDYLAHNVLAGLPDALRSFLVDTCVLGRLDGPLCDRLRDRDDSAGHLHDLEDRRLFLVPREDGRGHRYHEVLRAHLEVTLLERDGAVSVRARFRRAGGLLEADGAVAEALHAYTRAEAWDHVARLLGSDGPSLASGGRMLIDALPESLVRADPWLRLAQARALLGDGQLRPAVVAYREAEAAFDPLPAGRLCRDERAAAQLWTEVRERPATTLNDHLRAAVRRDPRRWARESLTHDTPRGLMAAGVALLLAGSADEARRIARRAGHHPDAEVFTLAAARALEHVAGLASDSPTEPTDLPWAAETFEQVGSTWLARLARAIASCRMPESLHEPAAMWDLLDEQVDPWGPPLLRLVAGIAAVVHDRPEPAWLEQAALAFRKVGGGTLEAWARAWEALARARRGDPEPLAGAEQARSLARNTQVPGAEAIAELAIAVADVGQAADATARATSLARELGLALPSVPEPTGRDHVRIRERAAPSRLVCFGGLQITLNDHFVDQARLKPQSRALLAILTMHAGTPVHRDQLIDVLWRVDDRDAALRRLPVLVSTVRRHLEPDAEPGDWSLLLRRGEAYVLQPPTGTYVDVHVVDDAAAVARAAHGRGAHAEEMAAHEQILAAYAGELLPEVGAAEWVVDEREHYRVQVARSAQSLAAWHLFGNDAPATIEAARAGLRVDRYRSGLWSLLADAHRAAGDLAAAARVEEEHQAVLEELGVEPPCCPSLARVTTRSGTPAS